MELYLFYNFIIAIKQYFWNKNIVFCIMENEISFRIFPKILFYVL